MLRRNCSTISVGGRVVGQVAEGRFRKNAKGGRHMLRCPRGWGVDVQSLADARDLGAETVEIHDIESGITYSAPVAQIVGKGFRFDRGYGPQICLPLQFWSVQKNDARQLALWSA